MPCCKHKARGFDFCLTGFLFLHVGLFQYCTEVFIVVIIVVCCSMGLTSFDPQLLSSLLHGSRFNLKLQCGCLGGLFYLVQENSDGSTANTCWWCCLSSVMVPPSSIHSVVWFASFLECNNKLVFFVVCCYYFRY